ncbi:uncharacterized protein LOC125457920 isoform X2 [Stegostoma tigrinum]|uniref:uncharacterized protein LOC125457920 isoform X2 n=1 Tax=Stegostoma tigrinum TaxID=3053191 RepID=UPI00286FEE7E|nr:uncharacterized protein LOC125457920 isoform X2 [Stegostoma tigrinum]
MKKMKKKKNGKKPNISIIIEKFLKSYRWHCAQTSSAVSSMLIQSLQKCIENEHMLTKFILARPETTAVDLPSVTLQPLLMTIRDERYMYGKELCVWHIAVNNEDIANLAIVLELRGRTSYPFSKLELLDCGIDTWSIERLGKAVNVSALTCIVLDFNELCDEGARGLCHGLKGNGQLLTLSMCHCHLGPPSGSLLGDLVANTAIRDLFLDGNNLQCEGACKLITFIADYAENMARMKFGASIHLEEDLLTQSLEADQSGLYSAMSKQCFGQRAITDQAGIMNNVDTGSKKKKRREDKQELAQIAPWLSRLHLTDNGIDGRGNSSIMGPIMFTQVLCQLIKFSDHLTELDLDNNSLGELCGKEILKALRERKEAKLQSLNIKVTAQMNEDTFSNILNSSKKLKKSKRKKKKK